MAVSIKEVFKNLERNELKYTEEPQRCSYDINAQQQINGSTNFTWARDWRCNAPITRHNLNRFEMVKWLLKNGADIKLRDSYDTPLTAAVREGNLQMVKLLLKKGADVDDCDFKGVPPIIRASKENKSDILELFLKQTVNTDLVDGEGNTALVAAVRNESSDVIQCLLKYGTDVNESKNDKTPLAWAAEKGSVNSLKVLLKAGADINMLSTDGNTALGTAVRFKRLEAARYLTNNNANVCKFGAKGKTPLLWAVLNQDIAMINWLLDHGAEYIIDSVFLQAIETGNLQVVQVLEKHGTFELEADKATSSLHMALNSVDVAKYLIKRGAKVADIQISTITDLFKRNNLEMVKLLIENGARLNELDSCGETVLTTAIKKENFGMAKYFVERGANIFQFLVDNGAKITEEDQEESPKLARYYRIAQESSLRKGKTSVEIGSNQEDAKE
ncbi:hypothetical protein Zmor_025581 [Zophobas morio]|uniref:Uncharacterized protein n=1 Tax=Zophobas morio TaxID=2755281 RepID=A0AA38HS38_9CUCU|nr:hypothetical protein Zmor_025581 [Zophobas morio]